MYAVPKEDKPVHTYALGSEPEEHRLTGALLFPDFITAEEEAEIVSGVDSFEWKPSQSGRRKQDFGPQINFKKRKLKLGKFKGFPRFMRPFIDRMTALPELSSADFIPIEMNSLEYTADRESSIAPHFDDFWVWGEYITGLNLLEETVITYSKVLDD